MRRVKPFITVSLVAMAASVSAAPCARPVYLTFDTGHMGVAPLVAEVLQRQQVKATFFLANEPTRAMPGRPAGTSLDDHWAPWWKALAAQGHDFGSHTWRHPIWQADVGPAKGDASLWRMAFRLSSSAPGQPAPRRVELTGAQYCEELAQSARRFQAMTGHAMRGIFRAPGGKTSPACWPWPSNVAGGMCPGPPPVFWAMNSTAAATPTRPCCARPCSACRRVTSCWRTWASGPGKTPGRPPSSSRSSWGSSKKACALPPCAIIRITPLGHPCHTPCSHRSVAHDPA